MLKPKFSLASLALLLSLALPGFADTVIMKGGEKVEGRILNETDTEVTIEVAITSSIKDERVIKKSEVEKIDKVQPDLQAWANLKNLSLGEESLQAADYQRAIAALEAFITQFPQSANVAEAKQKVASFQEEQKRVQAGEAKLGGKWLTKEEVEEERVQIDGRVLLGRMKRHAAAGQLVEAMNTFEAMEKSASSSSSYPDAVLLARQILPMLKAAADQGKVQLKAQADERKRRLENVQGPERVQLETLQKQQLAQTEATVANLEKSGVKWLPLLPATDRSLSAASTRAAGALMSLNQHNVPNMKDSLAATDRAREALENNDSQAAEQALIEASTAWSKNEYVARLQPKLAEAKSKAESDRQAAAKPAAAATPTPAPQPKATPSPTVSAVVEEEEPRKKEGTVLSKPAFWVILIVILGFAALTMKALGKFRDPAKNILDQ